MKKTEHNVAPFEAVKGFWLHSRMPKMWIEDPKIAAQQAEEMLSDLEPGEHISIQAAELTRAKLEALPEL